MDKQTLEALKVVVEGTERLVRFKWKFYNYNSEYYAEVEKLKEYIKGVENAKGDSEVRRATSNESIL